MMEAFAQRYCQCNPGVFQSTGEDAPRAGGGRAGSPAGRPRLTCAAPTCADTCYVLSFAVIMLNTSLHNPNVRDKPGLERFVAMNRGINEGGDLPEELLRVRPSPAPRGGTVMASLRLAAVAPASPHLPGLAAHVCPSFQPAPLPRPLGVTPLSLTPPGPSDLTPLPPPEPL